MGGVGKGFVWGGGGRVGAPFLCVPGAIGIQLLCPLLSGCPLSNILEWFETLKAFSIDKNIACKQGLTSYQCQHIYVISYLTNSLWVLLFVCN